MKRIKIGLLSTLISLSFFTGCSFNQNDKIDYAFIKGDSYLGHVTIDNVVYTYNNDNTATILCGKKNNIKKASFKSNIEIDGINYAVTDINDNAFKNYTKLEEVTLPNSLKYIGNNAFFNCSNLKSININEGLENIGVSAFEKCSNINSINLPGTLLEIGYYAFSSCSSLKAINVSKESKVFHSIDGVLYENNNLKLFPNGKDVKNFKIADFVTEISDCAFSYCSKLENINLNKIKKIGKYAFYNCENLKSVDFGTNLLIIDDGAFSNCSTLHYVDIPVPVALVGNYAFYACKELYGAKLSKSILHVGNDAFSECESLIIICEYGLDDNSWSSSWKGTRPVYWGATDSNVSIIDDVIYMLTRSVEKYATVIGRSNALENVIIPNSIKVNEEEFDVTKIALSAFEKDTHLKTLEIGDNVSSINSYAFYENTALESIKIENAPAHLESDSFNKCGSLKNIILGENIEKISSEAFREIPNSCFKSYDNAFYLGTEEQPYLYLIRSIATNIQSCKVNAQTLLISDAAFRSCVELKKLNIPSKVRFIGNYTLYNCPNLKALQYQGDKESWKEIKKGQNWNSADLEIVECEDGNLSLV